MQSTWMLALLLVAVPVAGRIYWRRRRGTQALVALARRKGLTFSALDLIGLHERYNNLQLIRRGHNRHAWNVMYGSVPGGLLAIFRYGYDLGFGIQQASCQWWVAVLESSRPLPYWRADPADYRSDAGETEPPEQPTLQGESRLLSSASALRVGQFVVRPENQAARAILEIPAFQAVLLGMTGTCHIECGGLLLAVAAPFEEQDSCHPERILDDICRLAEVVRPVQRVEASVE